MIAGVALALTSHTPATYNTINATPLPISMKPVKYELPLDLRLPTATNDKDTVIVHVHDTVYTPAQKKVHPVRRKNIRTNKAVIETDTIPAEVKQDTLFVPALYIIIPMEHLHESKDTIKC